MKILHIQNGKLSLTDLGMNGKFRKKRYSLLQNQLANNIIRIANLQKRRNFQSL